MSNGPWPRRRSLALAAIILAGGCERTPRAQAPRPARVAAEVGVGVQPLSVGPLSFFAGACARCHGTYGANYGEALRKLGDADLARVVDEMIVGPGMAELPPADVQAQVAYHRSLIDGRPFIAVTSRDGSSIAGEVTPGSVVEVIAGGRRYPARVSGHTWTGAAPEPGSAAAVEARAGEATTRLDLPESAHSHARPESP